MLQQLLFAGELFQPSQIAGKQRVLAGQETGFELPPKGQEKFGCVRRLSAHRLRGWGQGRTGDRFAHKFTRLRQTVELMFGPVRKVGG